MKILVLGGTGVMGVDLVKTLARCGEEVTVTKRKPEFEMLDMFRATRTTLRF